MDYIVNGGRRLTGEIAVYGAKNCALALLGATVLTEQEFVLRNCPQIVDVENMLKLLGAMGKKTVRFNDVVRVSGGLTTTSAPYSLATLLRGSALILGSTVAKYREIDLPLPGGCAIGARPMDIHLDGLEALGIEVSCNERGVSCRGEPKGARYNLRFASVGATENLLCACVLAKGQSVLTNCATEPEVVALEQLLVKMGANLQGVGTSTVVIDGVESLRGVEFDVIPDRIVAATYLSAAVATLGDVTVTNCNPTHLKAFLDTLSPHFFVEQTESAIHIVAERQPQGYGSITTAPYPLFPTDMQSLMLSLAAFSNGGSTTICEKLFENRLKHNADELNKMGASVTVDGDYAVVSGKKLHSACVASHDLRGGAGLVIAALNADGRSVVSGVEHINRGYSRLAENLRTLGADIVNSD
ncbi:MAG: UDP-N-acetylglucosamine 1-carboxyvinyltransferase [Clostridiales bacterium]|nr:UDP-N-acetylglucosamine 1-carboxyvinyltransferase [Clostridiales bacterium]